MFKKNMERELLFVVLTIFTLFQKIKHVAPQIAEYELPMDYGTDTIGSDLQGMKQLFNDLLTVKQFGKNVYIFFTSYDTRIRPRENQSQIVAVNATFIPQGLIEFDTSEQKFSILGYFRVRWKDEVTTWNPTDYADTNFIKVPMSEIWKPSIIILKAFDGDGVVGNSQTDIAKISSEGIVQWVPNGIYSIVCHVDIKYYPFDEQTCTITFYVSDETIATVELDHPDAVTLDEFTENSAWRIIGIKKRRYLKYNTYHVDVEFKLQRRASFATFTLIMPLLMLAFLNICMFLVPIGSGEKGSFAITIFLSYGIFVTIVSDTLPDNSLQISYFLLFIIVLLFMSVLSVLYTIVQAKLMASIGDKECTFKCCCVSDKSKNKVMPFEDESTVYGCDPDHSPQQYPVDMSADKDEEIYTWGMFLEKVDIIIFIGFFVLILFAAAGFFSLMLRRVSESTLSKI